jgi:hypothetical protein
MSSQDTTNTSAALDPKTLAADPNLSEDLALALLRKNGLPAEVLERLSKKRGITKSRRVKLAIVVHPSTPPHISLPLLRLLFTFQLMEVALTPAAPADIRTAAEEALIHRLETISSGEKLSLARRASGRIAAALLLAAEPRVVRAALENSRLTESAIIKALLHRDASMDFVLAVCRHPRWPLRKEIGIALLRNKNTPLELALEFARGLPPELLAEILRACDLPENAKTALWQAVEAKAVQIEE